MNPSHCNKRIKQAEKQDNIYYLLLTKKSKFATIVTIVFHLAVHFQPKMQKLFKAHSGFVKGKPNKIKLKRVEILKS